MLALTTYRLPRNLWIDLAFFGLSTITRVPPPPAGRPLVARAAGVRPDFGAALARGLAADLGFGVVSDDFAVLRATLRSYCCCVPNRCCPATSHTAGAAGGLPLSRRRFRNKLTDRATLRPVRDDRAVQ